MRFSNLILFFFLLITISVSAQTESTTGIEFVEGNWTSVLSKAGQEGKLIFLDIYASWCGPCKKLKRTTFANEKVGTFFNTNFICVAVDGEKGEGPMLSQRYAVRGYPTMLFIDGSGTVVHREIGFMKAKHLFRIGEKVLGEHVKRNK
jgi:thioredoxin 1